jgi:hypothetical protein
MAQKIDEFSRQKKLLESEIETIRAPADRDARRISRKVGGAAGNTRRIEGAVLDCGCASCLITESTQGDQERNQGIQDTGPELLGNLGQAQTE